MLRFGTLVIATAALAFSGCQVVPLGLEGWACSNGVCADDYVCDTLFFNFYINYLRNSKVKSVE